MTTPSKTTLSVSGLLERIRKDYPDIEFVEANRFSWHAGKRNVSYKITAEHDVRSVWALLHELGHALLNHADYSSDVELLQIEVAAWQKAHSLASNYAISIDEDYVQDALDSYRDWLHLRSTCPNCYERSLQINTRTYRCHNCNTEWHVTRSRLCRPYRRKR